MDDYWRLPEFWLVACWGALFVALVVLLIVEERRSRIHLFTLELYLMQKYPPPPRSQTDGEIFGSSAEITTWISPGMKKGNIQSSRKPLSKETNSRKRRKKRIRQKNRIKQNQPKEHQGVMIPEIPDQLPIQLYKLGYNHFGGGWWGRFLWWWLGS